MSASDKSDSLETMKQSGRGEERNINSHSFSISNSKYLTVISGRSIMGDRTNFLKEKNIDFDNEKSNLDSNFDKEIFAKTSYTTKYLLYSHLFPTDKDVLVLSEEDRTRWIKKFESLFDLTIADNNLSSCLGSFGDEMMAIFRGTSRTELCKNVYEFFYHFDQLTYKATLEISCFSHHQFGKQLAATLHLSNDGFFYGSADNFILHKSEPMDHHNSSNWYLLDKKKEIANFPTALKFAQDMMQITAIPDGQIFYSSTNQRMDIKFRHDNLIVAVQFEPGCPINDFDEDLWA